MPYDLGLLLKIHFADGRVLILSGGYFTSLYWWPGLLYPGAWDNANDNGKGDLRWLGKR